MPPASPVRNASTAAGLLPAVSTTSSAAPAPDPTFRPLAGFKPSGDKVRVAPLRYSAVRVDLAADVLFAVDSADLAPPAQASLVAAAEGVRAREPGPVQVVGHTDDQGTPEYNLDLSRRRAQSVADALGPLLGPAYPLDVQARG